MLLFLKKNIAETIEKPKDLPYKQGRFRVTFTDPETLRKTGRLGTVFAVVKDKDGKDTILNQPLVLVGGPSTISIEYRKRPSDKPRKISCYFSNFTFPTYTNRATQTVKPVMPFDFSAFDSVGENHIRVGQVGADESVMVLILGAKYYFMHLIN